MRGYILNFTFYTLAMIGVILLGYVVVRKSLAGMSSQSSKGKFLSIESALALEPRKNIYVLKAGSERFLVSTNLDQTQLLTKLDSENIPSTEIFETEINNISPFISKFNQKSSVVIKMAEKIHTLITPQNLKR